MIFKPQSKALDSRLCLETISPVESKQLFEPRVYRKKIPAFMPENINDGLMSKLP